MISARAHAVSDYLLPLGVAVLSRSRRFGWPVRAVMTAGPIWHLGYALLTRYEGGALPKLSMRSHLACDRAGALAFIASGLLMRRQKASHRLLLAGIGLGELALVGRTSQVPTSGGQQRAAIERAASC